MKTYICIVISLLVSTSSFAYVWTAEATGTTEIIAVWAADENIVYAGGTGNAQILRRESDGTWIMMSNPDGVGWINCIWGTDANNVWAGGSAGSIYHYDGNVDNQWTYYGGIGSTTEILAMDGTDANNIYATGFDWMGGHLFRFDGTAWTDITSTVNPPIKARGIRVFGVDDFWLAGSAYPGGTYDAAVSHRKNGVWTTSTLLVGEAYLTGIAGDVNNLVVVGINGRSFQYDGSTWTDMTDLGVKDFLAWRDVKLAGNGLFFACGDRGIMKIYANGVWTEELYLNFWQEGFNKIGCSGTSMWAVGKNGRIYRATIDPPLCDSPLSADLNCDEKVDFKDFATLADEWFAIDPDIYPLWP